MEEVVAVGGHHQNRLFRGQTVGIGLTFGIQLRQIDLGLLKQMDGGGTVVIVAGSGFQHGGQGGGAQQALVLAQGIGDDNSLTADVILRHADPVKGFGAEEGKGLGFIVAGGVAGVADTAIENLARRQAALCGLAPQQGGGNVVVTEEAGDLLCDVSHAFHVIAPGGNGDRITVHGEGQLFQRFDHEFPADLGADKAADAFGLQLQRTDGLGHGISVDAAADDLAGAQLLHQLAGALQGGHAAFAVDATLKPAGGLGSHTQTAGGCPDAHRIKHGGFKDDHLGLIGDLAVFTAHNAGNRNCLFRIGDDQGVFPQLPGLAVQGGAFFIGGAAADDDLAVFQTTVIKGVHGLAIFQHDVVGDVDNIVDRADACGAQAVTHPAGGGLDLNIFGHGGTVAGAQVRIPDLHRQMFADITQSIFYLRLGHRERLVKGCGALPGQPDDAQAVGTVVQNIKIKGDLIQTQHVCDVVAGFAVFLQDENAVVDAVGKFSLLGVQVRKGADGVGLGVIRHHVAFMEVPAGGVGANGGAVDIQTGVEAAVGLNSALQYLSGDHRPEDLVPGLNIRGNGGLFGVQRLVIVQQGGGGDGGIGKVPLLQAKLFQRAEHSVGGNAPQLAFFDLDTAGQGGLVQRSRYQITHMDVPGSGDDLDRLGSAHIHLANPHMVGIGMALHRQDPAHHHVGDLIGGTFPAAHHGAGHGHISGILFGGDIVNAHVSEVFQPAIR